MKRINNEENNNKYVILKLHHYHSNGNKTIVFYERNGIKKQQELNGILNEEVALHVLKKRNM